MADPSSSSRSRLTVLTGPMAGKELVLEDTVDNILIGSDPSCRFHVPGPGVSPIHARLWMDASGVTVYDTNSERGLYVNDDRVSGQAPLRNGDILWLGTPGEDDVVMIQCRLPTRAAPPPVPPTITPPPETHEKDAEETMVLTTSPEMAEAVAEAVAEEQPPAEEHVAPVPELEIDAGPTTFEAIEAEPNLEPEPVPEVAPAVEPAPIEEPALSIEEPPTIIEAPRAAEPVLEAVEEAAAAEPHHEPLPDEFAIQDTQYLEAPVLPPVEEVPAAPPPAEEEPRAEATFEPEAPEESAFTTPEVAPTPFEDEIGHTPVDSAATTAIMAETPLPPPEPELELPIAPPTVRVEPPAPPPPRPAAPPPAPAPPRPRPTPQARPAHPPVAAHPPARPRPAKPSSPVGMYAFLGAAVLLLLVAAGFFVARKRGAVTAPTPAPVATTPTTMAFHPPPTTVAAVEPPATTLAPVEEAVTIVKTPPPATLAPAAPSPAAVKSPAPSPSPKAAPSPSPRVAAATAAPTPPPGPSAEALRAQQAATLLGQAEAAAAGHSYDAAAGLFDEVLKLDPQNAKASAGKAAALVLAAAMKKTFVAGRTSVQSGKAGKGNMAGFDTEDVNLGKAPDYSGRIEFEVSPRNVKPGDNYTARVFLTNDGKKSFKIGTLNVTTTANGSKSGGAVASTVKEVQPQQRVALQEVTGVWQDGTTSWSLEVAVVSDHGDTFKNTVVWR